MLISHCNTAVIATITTISTAILIKLSKSTFPLPIIKSTALPVSIGTYKVSATVTAAKLMITLPVFYIFYII